MSGFELGISGVRSDRSTNWTTATSKGFLLEEKTFSLRNLIVPFRLAMLMLQKLWSLNLTNGLFSNLQSLISVFGSLATKTNFKLIKKSFCTYIFCAGKR